MMVCICVRSELPCLRNSENVKMTYWLVVAESGSAGLWVAQGKLLLIRNLRSKILCFPSLARALRRFNSSKVQEFFEIIANDDVGHVFLY